MAEITNLQQVLSLSGAVEKIQQVQQQQTVVHGEQFSAALKAQDDLKRTEVPTTEKTEEPNIREEYTERGGIKYRYLPAKGKRKEEEKEDEIAEKAKIDTEEGKIIDVIV
jgi:hypothetical protein